MPTIKTFYCYPSVLANKEGGGVGWTTANNTALSTQPLALKGDDAQAVKTILAPEEYSQILLCTNLLRETDNQPISFPAGTQYYSLEVWVNRTATPADNTIMNYIRPVHSGDFIESALNESTKDVPWPASWDERRYYDDAADGISCWNILGLADVGETTYVTSDLNDPSFGIGIGIIAGMSEGSTAYIGKMRIKLQYWIPDRFVGGGPYKRSRRGFAGRGYGR